MLAGRKEGKPEVGIALCTCQCLCVCVCAYISIYEWPLVSAEHNVNITAGKNKPFVRRINTHTRTCCGIDKI